MSRRSRWKNAKAYHHELSLRGITKFTLTAVHYKIMRLVLHGLIVPNAELYNDVRDLLHFQYLRRTRDDKSFVRGTWCLTRKGIRALNAYDGVE